MGLDRNQDDGLDRGSTNYVICGVQAFFSVTLAALPGSTGHEAIL